MLFPEEEAPILKAWIVKRLENTSDADADVLAEYVLALLRHDGSIDDVRKLCEEEIPDFLKEDSSVFVNDVFDAIQYKSYLPGAAPPHATKRGAPPAAQPPALPFGDVSMTQAPPLGPSQNGSRKRSYNERGDVDTQNGREFQSVGGRSFKQPRRGRGGRLQDKGAAPGGFPGAGYPPPPFPAPRPGDPVFDPNNPMDALLKMHSMGIPLPPMPDFAPQGQPPPSGQPGRRRQRCRDYDNKGYCARGNTCMFEHGTDSIFVPPGGMPLPAAQGNEEYDPSNAAILTGRFAGSNNPRHSQPFAPNGKGHSGPRDRQGQPRRARAPFSADGAVHDKSKSTIVVENIPEEKFSDEEVRGFFAQFGNVVDVSMQPYKRLAIVKFDSWSSANAAWRSPKVIFDNRFVKVFWYKEDESAMNPSMASNKGAAARHQNGAAAAGAATGNISTSAESPTPGPEIDMEEFSRKQEEAQKIHDEKMQKVQELERQREELEKRQKDLVAKQQEEKQKLLARLAASSKKTGDNTATGPEGQDSNDPAKSKPGGQTDALRAQLAALEAEAKQLGLDPDAMDDSSTWSPRGGRGRGRGGGFRARGFAPRGSRGGFQGRGGGQHAAYAAYTLDNRPKKVSVTGVDFTVPEKDEMLRQYLFGVGEFTDIQTTPAATQVTFKDRKTAEKFFFGISNKEIPGVEGTVELSWVSGPASASTVGLPAPSQGVAADEHKHRAKADDTTMTTGTSNDKDVAIILEHPPEQSEMDYDVADDSQWDIG